MIQTLNRTAQFLFFSILKFILRGSSAKLKLKFGCLQLTETAHFKTQQKTLTNNFVVNNLQRKNFGFVYHVPKNTFYVKAYVGQLVTRK